MAKRKTKSKNNIVKYIVLAILILIVAIIALQASGVTSQASGSLLVSKQPVLATGQCIDRANNAGSTCQFTCRSHDEYCTGGWNILYRPVSCTSTGAEMCKCCKQA